MSSVLEVRRPTNVELMLLGTILLWALNLTMTRYILTHGFRPLAYATVRYGLASLVFVGLTLASERTLRIERRDLPLVGAAALSLWLNQLSFVYSLKTTSASVIGLILGATPIFAALLGLLLRSERLSARFWLGAAISFGGVALVAIGAGGQIHGDLGGILLGVGTAATWAAYSVSIAPLMGRYSPSRISSVVLVLGWFAVAVCGIGQTAGQDYALGWRVWILLLLATLGPLVVTNMLWFRALHRIGPSRATLAANLQPFVASVIALLLLSETMTAVQVAGGVLIALGIVVARRRTLARLLPGE
jgi:drug/metabolite transporter (DMT)-like permease